MARLLYSATMSLDGFIAGPHGDMAWLTPFLGEPNETADRLLDTIGCLLVGGNTYRGDDPNAGTDSEGAFGGQYLGPSVVLTSKPPVEPQPGATFCTDLHDAVSESKRQAGELYVNVLGARTARSCLEAGLLDEVLVFFAPILLGDGVRLFDVPGGKTVRLELMPGQSEHWYRVRDHSE